MLAKQVSDLNRQISTLKDSTLKQLEDDLVKAKKKLEEGTVLFNAGVIPKNEFDSYGEEVNRIEKKIATRNYDPQLESLQSQLIMAQTELSQLNITDSEYIWGAFKQTDDQISSLAEQFAQQQQVILQDYAKQLDELENQYSEKSLITAKSSGIVSGLTVQPDDFVRLGDVLGNIVSDDTSSGSSDVVLYVSLDKGKLVEAGMDVNIYPTTVTREEHGYIIGRVVSVSASSVTQDHMMSILQNMQLVMAFSRDVAVIEVEIELLYNGATTSGYQWSTPKGAPFAIKSGTVCGGEIIVSNQRPIEKVVPFFKRLFQ
jgi:HlyD family secretion protein